MHKLGSHTPVKQMSFRTAFALRNYRPPVVIGFTLLVYVGFRARNRVELHPPQSGDPATYGRVSFASPVRHVGML